MTPRPYSVAAITRTDGESHRTRYHRDSRDGDSRRGDVCRGVDLRAHHGAADRVEREDAYRLRADRRERARYGTAHCRAGGEPDRIAARNDEGRHLPESLTCPSPTNTRGGAVRSSGPPSTPSVPSIRATTPGSKSSRRTGRTWCASAAPRVTVGRRSTIPTSARPCADDPFLGGMLSPDGAPAAGVVGVAAGQRASLGIVVVVAGGSLRRFVDRGYGCTCLVPRLQWGAESHVPGVADGGDRVRAPAPPHRCRVRDLPDCGRAHRDSRRWGRGARFSTPVRGVALDYRDGLVGRDADAAPGVPHRVVWSWAGVVDGRAPLADRRDVVCLPNQSPDPPSPLLLGGVV